LEGPRGHASATVLGGYAPRHHDGWMWDLSVPGGNDHDFYIDTRTAAVLVHNCPAPSSSGKPSGWDKFRLYSATAARLLFIGHYGYDAGEF
jgi:hypothetical protein